MRDAYNQIQHQLNPKFFEFGKLKPVIAEKSLDVAAFFAHMIDLNPDLVEDIVVTGSNTGFDYRDSSDFDIHLVVDKDQLNCDEEFVDEYFRLAKKNFDTEHDVTFYGVPVELYVEDVNDSPPSGAGRYSLFENEWLQKPTKDLPDENSSEVQMKVRTLSNEVDDLIADRVDVSHMKKMSDKIRHMRTKGLSRSGMSSVDNLIFKALRNNGTLQKIKNYITFRTDRELSLF